MDISNMQRYVRQFSEEKGFTVNTMQTRMLYLVTEVGELAQEILSISFHPTEEKVRLAKENIGLEMYDVIFNIVDLANQLDIDLEDAFQQKMEINKRRTWYE